MVTNGGDLDVKATIAMMRELGVTRLRTAGVEIELGPAPQAPVITPTEPDDPPAICRCGHDYADHGEVGCIHNCDLEKCAGSPQHPEPEAA